jgi:hypothetical protein
VLCSHYNSIYPELDGSNVRYSRPTSLRFISLLSFHLYIGLPRSLFPLRFPRRELYLSTLTCVLLAPPFEHPLFVHTNNILAAVQSFSLRSFPHTPATSYKSGPHKLSASDSETKHITMSLLTLNGCKIQAPI